MQCPMKYTAETDKIRWSKFEESVRKDVECSFGILKKRFQLFKMKFIGMTKIILIMPYFHVLHFIICYMNLMDMMKGGRIN